MKEPTQSSFWKEFMEYLKMIIFVVAVVLVVNNFLLINAKIPSESMEQTIMDRRPGVWKSSGLCLWGTGTL